MAEELVKYVNGEAHFDKLTQDPDSLVIVDFTASWCGPCKMMSPMIDQLANEYRGRATFVKVDIDQNQMLAAKHDVRGVPHFQVWKRGKMVDAFSGADRDKLSYLVKLHSSDMEPTPIVQFTTFPITSYSRAEAGAYETLLKKMRELNENVSSEFKLDDSEFTLLNQSMASLYAKDYTFDINDKHFLMLDKLSQWPQTVRFPALDVIRSFILHPSVASHYLQKMNENADQSLVPRILALLNSDSVSVIDLRMLWRFAANVLASDALRPALISNEDTILMILQAMVREINVDKSIRMPLSDALLNLVISLETAQKNDSINFLLTKSLETCIRLMTTEADENALCRMLVGLGTVIIRNPTFQMILCGNQHLKAFLNLKSTTCTIEYNIKAVKELLILLSKPL